VSQKKQILPDSKAAADEDKAIARVFGDAESARVRTELDATFPQDPKQPEHSELIGKLLARIDRQGSFQDKLKAALNHDDWKKRIPIIVREEFDCRHRRPEDQTKLLRWYGSEMSEISADDEWYHRQLARLAFLEGSQITPSSDEHTQEIEKALGIAPPPTQPIKAREAFVRPLLEKRGWSIRDWAAKANVNHRTANDYLEGVTNPYPSTRKKLAQALDLNELP